MFQAYLHLLVAMTIRIVSLPINAMDTRVVTSYNLVVLAVNVLYAVAMTTKVVPSSDTVLLLECCMADGQVSLAMQ